MSFFTLKTFQQYNQEVEAASTLDLKPLSPLRSNEKFKLDEKRPSSPNQGSSATSLSVEVSHQLEPSSAVNLARSADPWRENALLTLTACNYLDNGDGVLASAVAAMSLKVVDDDHPDEDWGDFVKSTLVDKDVEQLRDKGKSSISRQLPPPELERVESLECDDDVDYDEADAVLRKDHLDNRSSLLPSVDFSSIMPRNTTPTHAPSNGSNRQVLESKNIGEMKGFAATLLDRLLSLGSSSPRFSSPLSSPHRAPERMYDSYDVTFDRGPVGLNLETDWYGRQVVVKGFRAINAAGDEGPAKRCGMIRIGDVLTAINGESCLEMNFQETLELLRIAGTSRHTLHFKSLEAAGDLSIYASDKDLVQARAFIHLHKQRYYRPPRAQEGAPLILGCIERLRGEFVIAFNFHHEETGEFLLAASCASDGSGPFIFHTLRDSHLRTMHELPQSEDSAVYLGRLVPSFLGTDFTLFDHHTGTTSQHDHELAYLVYSANVLGRIPNSLKCIIAKPIDDDYDEHEQHTSPKLSLLQQRSGMGSDGAVFNTHEARLGRLTSLADRYNRQNQSRSMSITERLRRFTLDDIELRFELASENASNWLDDDDVEGHARVMHIKQHRLRGERTASMGQLSYGAVEQQEYKSDLLVLSTKEPAWNEELRAWTLNFQGRVKVASKKNFLLVGQEPRESGGEEEVTALRFGKVSKTRFSLDYAAPLAPIQALAVACSAFANKRAVT